MDRITKLIICFLLLVGVVQADQTIFQPTIFAPGSSLTIQSGVTATFASGSTVNFTGATVSGLNYEPALGNPSTSGWVLSSTSGGARSWIAIPPDAVTSVFTRTGAVVAAANDYTFAQIGSKPTTLSGYGITDAEPALGNPSTDGYVLSSTAAGARSWIAPPTGGGGGTPGGSAGQFQYNNGGTSFGGVSLTTYSGTTVTQVAGSAIAAKYFMVDPSDLTKKVDFNLANITTGTTRDVTFPNANSNTVVSSTASANQFATGISGLGVISYGQPAFAGVTGSFAWSQGPSVTAGVLLGRSTIGAGVPQEVTLGTGLSMSGTVLNATTSSGVTSIATTSPVQGGTITTTGTISLNLATDFAWTVPQSMTLTNASTSTSDTVLQVVHNSTATPGSGFGTTYWSRLKNSTTNTQDAGQIQNNWTTATAGSETSSWDFLLRNAGAGLALKARITGAGAVDASDFTVGGTSVRVPSGGAAGSALYKNTATNYDYSWDKPASVQTAVLSATAGTTSTSGVMAGFCSGLPTFFTPTVTGRVMVTVAGAMQDSAANMGALILNIRYGTGSGPAHGAAVTGTAANCGQPSFIASIANQIAPYSTTTVISGLTVGTAYWFDVSYASNNASNTAKLQGSTITVMEF